MSEQYIQRLLPRCAPIPAEYFSMYHQKEKSEIFPQGIAIQKTLVRTLDRTPVRMHSFLLEPLARPRFQPHSPPLFG